MSLEQSTPPIALEIPSLFIPETYVPKQTLLLNEKPSGKLFKIGSNELGNYYQIRPSDPNSLNIILLNRSFRKINLREHPQRVDLDPIIESLEANKEKVYFPSRIDPFHRTSQELVRDHWTLISPILKSDRGKQIVTPFCFLEVELEKREEIAEGIADAIGLTANGNFIIMEHARVPTPSKNGSHEKYRQVERHANLFLRKYGTDLSVRPVCIFYQQLDDQTMFLKIGHANQMLSVA